MSRLLIAIILIIPLIVTACQGEGEAVVTLPTRVIIPTETATDTATPTITPTATETTLPTLTTTATATATNTVPPTATRTPTATATATATQTPTVTLSPFMTATRTPTRTQTPPPTATAAPTITPPPAQTPTPEAPQIISFQSNINNAQPNTSLLLTWEASGDIARIDRLSVGGIVQETVSVPPSGQLPVTLPNTTDSQVIYRLTVLRGGLQASRSVPITIIAGPVCATPWFFGTAPNVTTCPSGAAFNAPGKIQLFQNGAMFTVSITGQERLYGLVYNTRRYVVRNITWDGTTTYTTPCGTAPEGLLNPQDVFNWAYHRTNGPLGPWCGDQGIGWATTGANTATSFRMQFDQDSQTVYIELPTVGVIRLPSLTSSGDWSPLQ